MLIRAVLFDLDGLMVDSEPHSLASWQTVLSSRGVTLDRAVIERMFGVRLVETARMLVDLYHLSDSPAVLSQEKEEYQIRHLDGEVKAMPGLLELLDEVERRGLCKAVASSGVRRYVEAVLKAVGLTGRFPTLVTAEDVVNGKPAPDVFLAAARAIHVDPQCCLVLEDAPSGIQAAKAAGMRCVAVPNQYTRTLDLSSADLVLPSLSAVHAALDKLIAE